MKIIDANSVLQNAAKATTIYVNISPAIIILLIFFVQF